ncbi:hypothetical protein EI94DRAFT_1771193 [Lactarius quietus]|nr:hypothetical protein EI94DRAFT_1771193 [Lactarius quietus]
MSQRSIASSTYSHERRKSKHRVADEDLFKYLSYLVLPKPTNLASSSNGDAPPREKEKEKEREHSSRISGAISYSITSIGDVFRDVTAREGSKNVKFPEKLIKVLEQRLENIAWARMPRTYSDQLLRRTMAVFYGQFKVETFRRQMKENRKIEELILLFATHATSVLRKDPRSLRTASGTVSHVSPELTARLDVYAAKLAPTSQTHNDSGYDTSSTSQRDSASSPAAASSVADMPIVNIVAGLFQIRPDLLQPEVDKLRSVCTERAALLDLKVGIDISFVSIRQDFDSDAAWQYWKTLETSHLSQLMVVIVQFNPELAKSTPNDVLPKRSSVRALAGRSASVSSRRSVVALSQNLTDADFEAEEEEDEVKAGHNFTYIPPNPKKYYKRLLELCLEADLAAMHDPNVNDDDQVSLGILSHPHIELINECALRWRISQPFRAACFLDLIKQLYERNEVPLDCVPEGLGGIAKVMNEISFDKWPIHDVRGIPINVYGGLVSAFLASVYHAMDAMPDMKKDDVLPFIHVLTQVKESGLLERFDVDIIARLQDVKERVRILSAHWYQLRTQELQATPGVNRALPLLLMTDDLEKYPKTLDKRFPEPILEHTPTGGGERDKVGVDIVSLFVEATKKLYEGSMNGPTPDTMLGMFEAFNPDRIDLGAFFEPYVRQWLIDTDNKTAQWVQAFESEGTSEGFSSSIVDLFDSLRSPITVLQDLEWSDEYQEARFFTSISKTINKAIEQYCRSIEELFMTEMYPRPTEFLQPQKSSAWIERAKQLAQGEKKIEPFNFQPVSCVNTEVTDNMYNQIQADKFTEVIESHAPPVPSKNDSPRFLFTVKIVMAEDLVPLDSSPSSTLDTFVTLSDQDGHRVAKTRTIYETLNPRWEETFDISVEKPLWLMVSVRDRALVGKHDTVGREYICLDPKRFGDFLVHDFMEGEKDDMQFYFGRAFRSLKRSEGDMVRIFIDKMSPFIRQSLSRNVLKSLVKGDSKLDYNKAIGNVTALYRSALGGSTSSEVQIPLPTDEKPRFKPGELSDIELEQAIVALFDYFDANLQTLNTYLSDTTKEMVMTRVWKDILATIEGLLIPPLSESPSEMKPLTDKEVDIVFKWLKVDRFVSVLTRLFYAGGEGPVPLENLQNQKYRDVVSIRLYYDWNTNVSYDAATLRASPSIKKRVKSVYSQRNLGTIKDRKREKKEEKEVGSGEIIMRILRMRSGTTEFIAQQLQILATVQAEQEQRERQQQKRKLQRPGTVARAPEIPPVPEIPS